jgi:hypothetical protein
MELQATVRPKAPTSGNLEGKDQEIATVFGHHLVSSVMEHSVIIEKYSQEDTREGVRDLPAR